MDIMISSGEIITCSPEINNDLFNATLGGMGLTGLILRVKFKLKKIETSFIKQKQIKAKNLTEILELFEEYKDYPYSMAWIDCLKQGKNYGRSIMMAGENAISSDLNDKQKRNPLRVHSKRHLVFPVNIPSFILNHYTIKAFNFAYYHKNLSKEINNTIAYDQFFYPLDTILHWNRGYGKKGVIQYQFVLPKESSHKGLVDILTRINKKGMGSFLAVLKLFGAQTSLISFPMEGYTLALDFPIRDRLFEFLDELDKMVLDYGGRIYLTKDARMKSDMFWKGYPNAGKFLEIVKKYNPEYKFRSLLSDRLKITTEP
jgi:FAD/FMN-containing dehydrogenase